KENVPVTPSREHHGVASMGGYFAADQVAHDYAFGVTSEDDQVEHFSAWKHFHGAETDLPAERLISAEQQLLAGLAARVERARHLRAAEGTIVEVAAVFAREGHALRHALINDVPAHLREAIDVGLA